MGLFETVLTIPGYRIYSALGRGAMGVVHRVRDRELGREVALKLVGRQLLEDPAKRKRFQREARVLARVEHPGVVRLFDFGVADGVKSMPTAFEQADGVRVSFTAFEFYSGRSSAIHGVRVFLAAFESFLRRSSFSYGVRASFNAFELHLRRSSLSCGARAILCHPLIDSSFFKLFFSKKKCIHINITRTPQMKLERRNKTRTPQERLERRKKYSNAEKQTRTP